MKQLIAVVLVLVGFYILFGGKFDFLSSGQETTQPVQQQQQAAAQPDTTGPADSGSWVCTSGGGVVSTVDPVKDAKTMENFAALAEELNRKNGTSWSGEYAWLQQGDCDISPPSAKSTTQPQQSGGNCPNDYYWDSETSSCQPVQITWVGFGGLVLLALVGSTILAKKLGIL